MTRVVQIILIAWFLMVSLFIFIPSYNVLKGIDQGDAKVLPKPPDPPPSPPNLSGSVTSGLSAETQQELIKAQVSFYTQQVATHNQQIDAYKKQLDSLGKTRQILIYELVIKQTIVTLIAGLTSALVAFAFVKAEELMRRYLASRQSLVVD
jgi:ABC-type glycerol-3-phosphate transport system permease component